MERTSLNSPVSRPSAPNFNRQHSRISNSPATLVDPYNGRQITSSVDEVPDNVQNQVTNNYYNFCNHESSDRTSVESSSKIAKGTFMLALFPANKKGVHQNLAYFSDVNGNISGPITLIDKFADYIGLNIWRRRSNLPRLKINDRIPSEHIHKIAPNHESMNRFNTDWIQSLAEDSRNRIHTELKKQLGITLLRVINSEVHLTDDFDYLMSGYPHNFFKHK